MEEYYTNKGGCKRQSPLANAMHRDRLGNMDDYPEYYYG